jgi:hypothetical protein
MLGLDPSLDLRDIYPISSQLANTLAASRLASTLIAAFGLVALLLASIGLYGVMAWMVGAALVNSDTHGAGRATKGHFEACAYPRFCLVPRGRWFGVIVAWDDRLIDTQQLYEVSATDPFTFAAISLLLVIVSLLACTYRRAAQRRSIRSLRSDMSE